MCHGRLTGDGAFAQQHTFFVVLMRSDQEDSAEQNDSPPQLQPSLQTMMDLEALLKEVLVSEPRLLLAKKPPHFSAGDPHSWHLKSLLLKQHGRGSLTDITVEQLNEYLQPMLLGLQNLDAESLLQLQRVEDGSGARLRDCVNVLPISEKITPQITDQAAVRYLHVSEVPDQYSMGIFVFPPHAKIPLHDHPGMCVLSRLLYGDLRRISLDLPRERGQEKKRVVLGKSVSSWLPWSHSWTKTPHGSSSSSSSRPTTAGGSGGGRLAYKHHIDVLKAPDCTVLYPFEGNLHEFMAGPQGAAVLDILLPPYNADCARDCTFYEIHDVGNEQQHLQDASSSSTSTEEQQHHDAAASNQGDPCWIVPTGQPEDFHCISGQYLQLG